jgi:hypothetical protein
VIWGVISSPIPENDMASLESLEREVRALKLGLAGTNAVMQSVVIALAARDIIPLQKWIGYFRDIEENDSRPEARGAAKAMRTNLEAAYPGSVGVLLN